MSEDNKLARIADRFGLDIIYVFGSNSKNVVALLERKTCGTKISPLSDVDIGVKPVSGKRLSVKEKVNLSMELEDIFSVNRVDLVVIPEADPFLAANIIPQLLFLLFVIEETFLCGQLLLKGSYLPVQFLAFFLPFREFLLQRLHAQPWKRHLDFLFDLPDDVHIRHGNPLSLLYC